MKIIIDLPAFKGEYDLRDLWGTLTGTEQRIIKLATGLRFGEYEEAIAKFDYDLVLALAKVAARRLGTDLPDSVLWDAEIGKVTIDLEEDADDGGDDAGPPVEAQTTGPSSAKSDGSSSDSKSTSSGDGSASSENGLSRTGSRGSEAVAASAPATSETSSSPGS